MTKIQEGTVLTTELIVSSPSTRYFLIKSYSHDNIGRSLQHGVWATSPKNERLLHHAYDSSSFVVLFFSVNHSSRFSGYAIMTSIPGESSCEGRPVFSAPDGTDFPGKMFSIHWLVRCELFFKHCEHLINTHNDNKSVKVGRDGQEVDALAGSQLCLLMEEHQKPENRPVPLIWKKPLSLYYTKGLTSLNPSKKNNNLQKPLPLSVDRNKSNLLVEQLAAVATVLKQGSVSKKNTSFNSSPIPNHSLPLKFSNVPVQHEANATPPKLLLSFEWVEEEIKRNPILSIFPLDLTKLQSYEDYLYLLTESQTLFETLEQTYGSENIPPLPKSVALSKEESSSFDATFLINILCRSASQEDVDRLLKSCQTPSAHLSSFKPNFPPTPHVADSKQSIFPFSNYRFKPSQKHPSLSNTFLQKTFKRHYSKNEFFVNKEQPSNHVENFLTTTQLSQIPSRSTRTLQLALPSQNVPIKKYKNSHPAITHELDQKN